MRKYNLYILTIALSIAVVLSSCTEDAESPDLAVQPAYIQFDQATVDDSENGIISVTEPAVGGTSTVTLTVENPFGVINEDITVSFSLGGDAVLGTDYTLADATDASGGTFVIENRQDSLENGNPGSARDDYDLDIVLLGDGDQDGDKSIVVTILGGTTPSNVNLGTRSGLSERGELTVAVSDFDCGFATGDYTVTSTILQDDFGQSGFTYPETLSSEDCANDGMYIVSDITGGLWGDPSSQYVSAYSSTARAATLNINPTTGAVTWTGVSDQFGGEIVEDPADPVSSYDSNTGVITISWRATAFGERGITTLTPQ